MLDERIFGRKNVERKRGLTALLLRLDRAKTPEAVDAIAQVLIPELRKPEYESIRKVFMALMSVIVEEGIIEEADTLQEKITEAFSMLAENIRNMVNNSHMKGMELGRLEGRVGGLRMAIIRLAKGRWANAPQNLIDTIYSITDVKPLEDICDALLYVENCEDFERIVDEASAKPVQ